MQAKSARTGQEVPPPLPRLVADLPKNTMFAVYLPHLDLALTDIHAVMSVMQSLDPDPAGRTVGALLARELGVEGLEPREVLSELLTPAGLASIGVDAGGGAVVVPALFGEPIVFAVELRNRPRFEAWLEELAPGENRRLPIGGEQASVLFPNSERPITCLARQTTAYCQLGAAAGADPIAPLRATAGISPPAFGTVAAIARAYTRLRDGAHAYAFVHGEAAAKNASELALAWAERNHRFDGRKRVVDEAQALAPKIRRSAEMIEAAVSGLYLSPDNLTLETELSTSERGSKLLRELAVNDATNAEIARWFETPALARVLLRMKGERAERWLAEAGIEVPANSLSGTMALLMFGVDPQCSAAKKQDASASGWALLLPSALAVGLRGANAADAMQSALVQKLGGVADQTPPSEDAPKMRPMVRGNAGGSAYEVQVLDELAVFGTGPGSGSAALRRLRSVSDKRASEPRAFVHAAIHPRAIDAALDAGNISRENRRELVVIENLRRRLRPLVQQIDAIELVAQAAEAERRVMIDLEVRR